MEPNFNLARLLAPGDIRAIAVKLGLSTCAASAAIRRANPGHPAVREAYLIAKNSGALEVAQGLATLKAV